MVLDLNMMHEARSCRVCGCTDENCAGCIERTGEPCYWVFSDLCSACARTPSDEERQFLEAQHWSGSVYRGLAHLWAPPGAGNPSFWYSLDEALEAAGWKDGAATRLRATTGADREMHAVGENDECAPWCRACKANVQAGMHPDGAPVGEATTGAGAAAGPAHTLNGEDAHVNGPGLGGLQTDPSPAAAGGAGNSGAGPRAACSQEPTGLLRDGARSWQSPLRDRPGLRFRLWQRIGEYKAAGPDPTSRLIAVAGVEAAVGELMAAASRAAMPARATVGTAPDLLFGFWQLVHEYVGATRTGRASDRDEPALALERAVFSIVQDACRRVLTFASHEGWRSLAQAIGKPGLELEPKRLLAVVIERMNVLEACKMPDDPELVALLRAAAGLPAPVVTALRDVAEAAAGDIEAGTVRAALGRFVGLLSRMVWGKIADETIEHHADDAVVVREVLGRSGFLFTVEKIGGWSTDQRRAALRWATLGRFGDPPAPAPAFLEEGSGE
jgi:hypothetical protein